MADVDIQAYQYCNDMTPHLLNSSDIADRGRGREQQSSIACLHTLRDIFWLERSVRDLERVIVDIFSTRSDYT